MMASDAATAGSAPSATDVARALLMGAAGGEDGDLEHAAKRSRSPRVGGGTAPATNGSGPAAGGIAFPQPAFGDAPSGPMQAGLRPWSSAAASVAAVSAGPGGGAAPAVAQARPAFPQQPFRGGAGVLPPRGMPPTAPGAGRGKLKVSLLK
jgi:hypothetical protein